MTKMVTTSIYGKKLSNILFSRTSGLISTKLGMYHWGLRLIIVCSNYNPGTTLTCFTAMSNCVTYAFLYEKVKIDFSETIAACDLKDGRCIQLIE